MNLSTSSAKRRKLAAIPTGRKASVHGTSMISDPDRLKGRYDLSQSADFAYDLYGLLQDADNDRGIGSIISWQLGGTSFRIHDKDAFVSKLLKVCSGSTQYNSFVRILQRVGFEFIRHGELQGGYRHPDFCRGRPQKLKELKSVGRCSSAWYDLGSPSDEAMFPRELHRLLQEARQESYERMISWHKDGKSFHVHDRDLFELMLLQKYTNLGTYHAFRQCLERYGFEEVVDGKGGLTERFRHPSFVRDQPKSMPVACVYPSKFMKSATVESTSSSSLLDHPRKMKGRYDLGHSDDFPFDLYGLLQDAETDPAIRSIISWQSGGTALQIHDREQFVEKILQVCSTNTKYPSFATTLRRFGFRRVADRPKECIFEHRDFRRGLPQNLIRLRSTEISYSKVILPRYDLNNADDDAAFCRDLYRILQDAREETYERLITWDEDGKSFRIHDLEIFEHMIVKKYTTCESFQAFQQSLRDYGFERIRHGDKAGSYEHESFLRNQPENLPTARIGHSVGTSPKVNSPCHSPLKSNGRKMINISVSERRGETSGHFSGATNLLKRKVTSPVFVSSNKSNVFESKKRKPETSWTAKKYDLRTTLFFVNELHRLLEDADKDESLQPIISWHRDGKSFKVHDCHLFERMILRNYSNMESYDSFTQELRFFNFIEDGQKSGGYCHRSFIRARPEKVDLVLRGIKNYRLDQSPDFPFELYALLEDSESHEFNHFIKWQPGGKSFVVVDEAQFERRILLKFTTVTEFSSFEQILFFFLFRKLCRGQHREFSHPHFLRGESEKLHQVKPTFPFSQKWKDSCEKQIHDTSAEGSYYEEVSTGGSIRDNRTDEESESESVQEEATRETAPFISRAPHPSFRAGIDGTVTNILTASPDQCDDGEVLVKGSFEMGKNSALVNRPASDPFHHPLYSIPEIDQKQNAVPVQVVGKMKMLLSLQAANAHVQDLLLEKRRSELEKLRKESAPAESLVDKAAFDLGVTTSEFRSLLSDYRRDMGESRTRIFHEICMWNSGFPIPNGDEVSLFDKAIPCQLLVSHDAPFHHLATVRRCHQLETFLSLLRSLEGQSWFRRLANWTSEELSNFVRRRVCEIVALPGRLEQELHRSIAQC